MPESASARSHPTAHRVAWLVMCIAVGSLVGAVGSSLTGSDRWYLAIPFAVAIGWFFIANPLACEPSSARRDKNGIQDREGP
jgi:hypothetical protein